jgi:predicted acetyltransferase
MTLSFEAPSLDRDLDACASIISQAFASPTEGAKEWVVSKCGWQNMRIIRDGQAPLATLLRIPMAQFFGGVPIPMVGVAGVGVLPAHRGRGVGKILMIEALREMRREGTPISSLYPATVPFYQHTGYERAGTHFEHRFPVTRLPQSSGLQPARPYTPSDLDAVKACYARTAPLWPGSLQRGDYIWDRILNTRSGPAHGFVIDGPLGIEAYAFLRQERPSPIGRHEIHTTDLQASTPQGARALLTFLAGYGSLAEDLVMNGGGPLHPITPFLPEHRWLRLTLKDYWMLRLVDLPRALTVRGYPQSTHASLVLNVHDEHLPENSGRWLLRVHDGQASCEPAANASPANDIRCDVQSLAAVYAGFLSPLSLFSQATMQGPQRELETLAALMPTAAPACFDFF